MKPSRSLEIHGKKAKVVLFPAACEAVGVATHTLHLARLLNSQGMLDCVVCPSQGWLTDELDRQQLPYTVLRLSYQPSRFLQSNLVLFRFLTSRPNATCLHVHGRFPLFTSLLVRWRMARRVKVVTTVHQFSDVGLRGFLDWKVRLETWILRRMDKVIAVSPALFDEVTSRMEGKRDRVHLIPNWIEPLEEKPEKPSGSGFPAPEGAMLQLCFVGRLAREKGLDILLFAIKSLSAMNIPVHLDVFGDGDLREWGEGWIKQEGLEQLVTFHGQVSAVSGRLSAYDAVVIPSRSESFSLVALESYAALVPVIASDVPGLNQVVESDHSGMLFPSENPDALVDVLCKLRRMTKADIERLVRGGKEVLSRYSLSQEFTQTYVQFYDFEGGGSHQTA